MFVLHDTEKIPALIAIASAMDKLAPAKQAKDILDQALAVAAILDEPGGKSSALTATLNELTYHRHSRLIAITEAASQLSETDRAYTILE